MHLLATRFEIYYNSEIEIEVGEGGIERKNLHDNCYDVTNISFFWATFVRCQKTLAHK